MNHSKGMHLPTVARWCHAASAFLSILCAIWAWLGHRVWLALPLLAIPAWWPFYREGLPRSLDGTVHLLRLGVLDYHIRQGVLYPRWSPELMLGYGYPVFSFYAPGAYYLVEGLRLLGFSLYTAFILVFCGLILVAGFGMFLLACDLFGTDHKWSALIAATAYMFAPYLLSNVYIRGGIAETGAQAILPWVLWSMRRLIDAAQTPVLGQPTMRQPAVYLWAVAFSLGSLAITHTLALLLVPPLLIGYIVVRWWQTGPTLRSLGWVGGALLLAMGISAFFWLPLLGERSYLAATGYQIAKTIWLPTSGWTWGNFLDTGWTYTYTFIRPPRLGWLQLVLAGAGWLAARRRDAEWLFFLGVALSSGLAIGVWTLPLWLSNDTLAAVQFPWRLLILLSLPLALFAGGIPLRLRAGWWQTGVGLLLLAIILLGQQPYTNWMEVFSADGTAVDLPLIAQLEAKEGVVTGGESSSLVQEFRSRWAAQTLMLAPSSAPTTQKIDLTIHKANAYALDLTVTSAISQPLRFQSFYFPGWQAHLDEQTALTLYPSTNLGLLTVDLPPGNHHLQLSWAGTTIQRWAGMISLLTLALFSWHYLRRSTQRWLGVIPVVLLLFGSAATLWPQRWAPVQMPEQIVEAQGVRLVGLRTEQAASGHLRLYPYWYVYTPPPAELRMRWQLQDAAGHVLDEVTALPYFNTLQASNWPVGTLVDDAYQLALPPGLPVGVYQVAVRLGVDAGELAQTPVTVGRFTLAAPVAAQPIQPAHALDINFGHVARLAGYSVTLHGRQLATSEAKPGIVQAGQYVNYTLYWQTQAAGAQPIQAPEYHTFIHLIDSHGRPLVQLDQSPGPILHPSVLWDRYYLQPDGYLLRLPQDALGGLYWPAVGIYAFASQARLLVQGGAAQDPDQYRLPPIKLVGRPDRAPTQPLKAQLGDLGRLLGYDLSVPAEGLQAGDRFVITLYYRSEKATTKDYTRFVHLYQDGLGMAAQYDSPPQDGVNPTWTWQPDEVIVDVVELQVAPTATSGVYPLWLGFYDAKANGTRLPLRDALGNPVPNHQLRLTDIHVRPK